MPKCTFHIFEEIENIFMENDYLGNLESDIIAYLTDCDRECPPSIESLPPYLLDRGIIFAVHVPSIFPRNRYSGTTEFISQVIRDLGLVGAYEFRTEGFYKSRRDQDNYRIVSYVNVSKIPGMIRQFKERLKKLQIETRQECLFISVGLSSAFFDCWQEKGPDLLFEQNALQELSEQKEKAGVNDVRSLLANPPKLVVIRGFSEGEFMDRFKKGIDSMADVFGFKPIWVELSESKPYLQSLREAIETAPDAIIVHHGHTGKNYRLRKKIENIADQAIKTGIKIVVFDTRLSVNGVTEVSQDDMFMSILLARKIDADFSGQAKVGVLYINDAREYLPLQRRNYAWKSAVKCYPRIRQALGCEVDVSASQNEKKMMIKNALIENREITDRNSPGKSIEAIVAMWDEFAKAAVRAVNELISEKRMREKEIKIYSMDLVEEDLEIMKQNRTTWVATVATDPYQIGRVTVRTALLKISGDDFKSITMEPSLITSENLFELPAHNISDLHVFRGYSESHWAWKEWMPGKCLD